MKTLLWKDYRENRKVLMVIAVFVLVPYTISAGVAIADLSVDGEAPWMQLLWGGSAVALYLSAGVTSFIAGNAIAGERADRSAEFAAYLPISRRSAITSKALLAVGSCLCILGFNFGINQLALVGTGSPHELGAQEVVLLGLPAVILMFGVAWCFSSLSSSPVIAAASGVVAFLLQMGTLALSTSHTTGRIADSWPYWYWSTSLIAGVGGFVVGVIYYLRRVEP